MKALDGLLPAVRAGGDLATDSRSLDALRRQAGRDPQQSIKGAARQFEALFMQMVLKSMRDATPKSGLFDSSAGDLYAGMLDQQRAHTLAGRTGLAEMIERQLMRHIQPQTGGAAKPVTGAAATGAERVSAAAVSTKRPTGPGEATVQSVFVNRLWDHALTAQRETGLPAKFIIGQAALESGWGQREITGADGIKSYNLFGLKASGGWKGRTVDAVTTEYENGVPVRKTETFRAYNSYAEAIRDWARLLSGSSRYAGVLAQGGDAAGFAHGLQRAGYATDPNYGAKLKQVIETAQALRRLS
jgi:flagellar protein FlgJ